ncbi:DapH/DapD/GlmU-related protein [Micromonospora cremea]|uniref:DapH/DapD/GlmU-related protein n=1 Tax=Micromonospora cremea TaxID=709881 RepID=UPI001FCBC61D|nr:DapH/DapD/GlmU-related protein [Micromonospora cremea]
MTDVHWASHDGAQIAASADVDERATIRPGTRVWHLAQVREHASAGRNCVIGRGAYVGPGVRLGDNVKLQNHALVYEPAELADGSSSGRPRCSRTTSTRARSPRRGG